MGRGKIKKTVLWNFTNCSNAKGVEVWLTDVCTLLGCLYFTMWGKIGARSMCLIRPIREVAFASINSPIEDRENPLLWHCALSQSQENFRVVISQCNNADG